MAAFTAPENEAGCRQLLLEASSTMVQIANIARPNSSNMDISVFYSHLAFNCARIPQLLETSSYFDGRVAGQILGHLDSLIPEHGIQEMPYAYSTTDRLKMLTFHWNLARGLSTNEQLDFISRWLKPNVSAEEREALDRALEDRVDELSKRQPIQRSKDCDAEPSVKSLGEPQSTVQRAAQSSFEALHNCKKCMCPCPHENNCKKFICPCPHDFMVKLELGTYRQPPKSSKVRARQYHYTQKTISGLDFEVFLRMEKNWHEIAIHAVGKRVGFSLPREEDAVRRKKVVSTTRTIEILCEEIPRMISKPGQRLELELNQNQLFDMGFEKTSFYIADPAEDVSLTECIKEFGECFTERTKRILYLIIGHTVLHLHDTSWLQSDWGSANIKFFRTSSSEIPLRPFIEARLDDEKVSLDAERDDIDAFYHPCPVLVSLAVVLLELYFVKPFSELAKQQNVVLIEDSRARIAVTDLYLVYYGDDGEVGCQCQIPEDSGGLRVAIESCIDGGLWEDDEGNPIDRQTLRSRIYQHVVEPLETYLSQGFSQIPLESIDRHAQTIDITHRGRFITCKDPDGWPRTFSQGFDVTARALSHTALPLARSPAIQAKASMSKSGYCSQFACQHSVTYVAPDPRSKWKLDVGKQSAGFFDDEMGDHKK